MNKNSPSYKKRELKRAMEIVIGLIDSSIIEHHANIIKIQQGITSENKLRDDLIKSVIGD